MKKEDRLTQFREAIKRGEQVFELAPQDKVFEFEYEVGLILETLGHPEALVTDESKISDFREETDEIAELLGVEVNREDYIWQVAERLIPIN